MVDFFSAAIGTSVDYTLWISAVGGDNGNTMVSATESAIVGATDIVIVDYSGLNVDSRYLGVMSHQDAGGEHDRTIVEVNTQ